jgi:hypothetical protein
MSAANASPAWELMNAARAHIASADSTSGTTTCHRRSAAAHAKGCVGIVHAALLLLLLVLQSKE